MPTFHFHQTVITPNGPGIVQGQIREADQVTRIIVSHNPSTVLQTGKRLSTNSLPGVWVLAHYDPEQLRPA